MPGFRGIKMVSFDKKQKQMVVQIPRPVENNSWPESAVSMLIDIMAGYHVYLVSQETENQREEYYQKAFEALSNHLMRLEKDKLLSTNFLGTLTIEKMKAKWQEIENTYRQISGTLKPDGPPGSNIWPFYNKMEFLYQSGYVRTPEARTVEKSATQTNLNVHTKIQSSDASKNIPESPKSSTDNRSKEYEEQQMITAVIEKIIPRVLKHIKDRSQPQCEFSMSHFETEVLSLKRRKLELLEQQKIRQETEQAETRVILSRLTDVLEKLNDKL